MNFKSIVRRCTNERGEALIPITVTTRNEQFSNKANALFNQAEASPFSQFAANSFTIHGTASNL